MASIVLEPATPSDFEAWYDDTIVRFAQGLRETVGMDNDAAVAVARAQTDALAASGINKTGHQLWNVLASGRKVGFVLTGSDHKDPGTFWIYDLVIDEADRRQGYGRATMARAQEVARERGYSRILLNVLWTNEPANNLYLSLGFHPISRRMAKSI